MIPQPIGQVPLLQKLTDEERELITARLHHHAYSPNELILQAGKPAEIIGFVVSGRVKLEADSPNGPVLLANLGAGAVIGEVDTLLKHPYSCSVRAGSAVDILVLARPDLEDLILQHPGIGLKFSTGIGKRIAYLDDYLTTQRLQTQPLFSALAEEDLRALAAMLDYKSLARGETLLEPGEPGDSVYLVESGLVRVVTNSGQGDDYTELGEGELIGLQALVTGKPYASTVFAISDVEVWVLQQPAYQELVVDHPAIKLAFSRAMSERLSPEEQALAVERLRDLPIFSDTGAEALRDMAGSLILRHYPAGEQVYLEGTPGDALYFVSAGAVSFTSGSGQHDPSPECKPGQSFGEMALFTGRTRSETARAVSDTTCWVLYKTDYDSLLTRRPDLSLSLSRALGSRLLSDDARHAEQHLSHIKIMEGLGEDELREISETLQGSKFRTGEVICYAGEPVRSLFLIDQGQARTIVQSPGGQVLPLEQLEAGDSFGEAAIVQNSAQNFTVQATSDVELFKISQVDANRLIKKYPTLALNITRRMAEQAQHATQRLAQMNGMSPTMGGAPPARQFVVTPPPPVRRSAPAQKTSPALGSPSTAARPVAPRSPAGKPNPYTDAGTGGNSSAASQAGAPGAQANSGPGRSPLAVGSSPSVNAPAPAAGLRTVPARPWDRKGGAIMRPMPAAAARPLTMMTEGAGAGSGARGSDLASWFGSLSTSMKVQMAVIGLLVMILVCVVVPVTILSVATSAGAFFSSGAPTNELPPNEQTDIRGQVNSGQSRNGKIAQAETATPQPTRLSPIKSAPTLGPTSVPTKRPLPTLAPRPTQVASAAASPAAKAAVTGDSAQPAAGGPVAAAAAAAPKAPPLPPLSWDARLGPGGLPLLQGIHLEKSSVPSGQKFWMLTRVKFEDAGAESGNDHTIYLTLLDEEGKRVEDANVVITWDESGGEQVHRLGPSDEKPAGDMCLCNYNWPMYGAGYGASVEGLPSDKIVGMIMPMHRHVNYKLTFQRLTMP